MQWEFRRVLEDFENYKAYSQKFISDIDRGEPGVLDLIVRELQLIVEDGKEKIESKVLAIRFARDIMVLGKPDIVKALVKIVPAMLKICSYRLQSQDPDRGQTYFHDHPLYSRASEDEKNTFQKLGSTYFTLNIESIYHWAKWIPVDDQGNQSIYSKAYNTLLQRGVGFQQKFNYYKNSDTQKFKNIYRIQFFSQSSMDYQSRVSNQSSFSHTNGYDNRTGSYFQNINFDNTEKIKNYIYAIDNDNQNRFNKLAEINRVVSDFHYKRFAQKNKNFQGREKDDKIWLENFMINYSALMSKKIDYHNFIKKIFVEQLCISQISQASNGEISDKNLNPLKKIKTSAKRQQSGSIQPKHNQQINKLSNSEKQMYQNLLKTQQTTYKRKIQSLNKDLKQYQNELKVQNKQFEKQKKILEQEYQQRIREIIRFKGQNSGEKTQLLEKQNMFLKDKIQEIQQSFKDNSRSRGDLENERDFFNAKITKLTIQNEKLRDLVNNNDLQQKNGEFLRKIKQLEKQLKYAQQQKISLNQSNSNTEELSRKNKQLSNLQQQLKIYKMQLSNQRQKSQKQKLYKQQKLNKYKNQNKQVHQKNILLQKKLDIKELQTNQLLEQIRLLKLMDRQTNSMMKNYLNQTKARFLQQPKSTSSQFTKTMKNYIFQYKNYEKLRNSLKFQKQKYLRFCRCCLKNKDLLYKDNQFELGIISQTFSQKQINFVLYFTNTSDEQIETVEIEAQSPAFINTQLASSSILCIRRQQQQKITLKCEFNKGNFLTQMYQPIILKFYYKKLQKFYEHQVLIPFLLFKTLKYTPIVSKPELSGEISLAVKFNYTKKILPDLKYLSSYFPEIEEIYHNNFQCQFYQRITNLRIYVNFQFKENSVLEITLQPLKKEGITSREKLVLEDLIGFFQFCFRK